MDRWMLLIIGILIVFVFLIGASTVDSCWFNIGDEVVAIRGGSLFTEPLERGTPAFVADLKQACYLEAGENLIITIDATGCMTWIDFPNFDCWQFVRKSGCSGWTWGSNLSRVNEDKK